jgi:hypothetical protein
LREVAAVFFEFLVLARWNVDVARQTSTMMLHATSLGT